MKKAVSTLRYSQHLSNKRSIVMIGPDLRGLGGISRVVSLWKKAGFFASNNIKYLSTTDEFGKGRLWSLIICFFHFLFKLPETKIIYIHTASFNSFYRKSIFLFLAFLFKKKVILHIHPVYFFDFISGFNGPRKYLFKKLLLKIRAFIVLTPKMQQRLREFFPDVQSFILPNPIDLVDMRCNEEEKRFPKRLLFLGWYVKGKGIYELVDAIKILQEKKVDVMLDFYGTKNIDQLRNYVKIQCLEKCVYVHDWIDDNKKREVLCRCTALVLPSYTEGIPNVILEAMATKTPIIATSVGGIKEILHNMQNAIIVKVGDANDLAKKIEFVIKNPAICKQLANRAYSDVVRNHNLEDIVEKLEKFLISIE